VFEIKVVVVILCTKRPNRSIDQIFLQVPFEFPTEFAAQSLLAHHPFAITTIAKPSKLDCATAQPTTATHCRTSITVDSVEQFERCTEQWNAWQFDSTGQSSWSTAAAATASTTPQFNIAFKHICRAAIERRIANNIGVKSWPEQ
jgi:hypothetical protein